MAEAPTILITGATDGLGRALAHRLAADGATLILHGRDPEKLAKTAGAIGQPLTVCADLAELAQVRRLADDVRERTDRLDVLVSNAGIGSGEPDGRELVSDRSLAGVSGHFFDRTREARANAQAYDPKARATLWQRSLELTRHADIT